MPLATKVQRSKVVVLPGALGILLKRRGLISMTVRPELFRAKATECKVAAHRVQDPEIKEAYLDLMRGWRELAEQVERIEHSWLDRYGF